MTKEVVAYLSLKEEYTWAHYHVGVSSIQRVAILLSLTCLTVGLILAASTDIRLPTDNFVDPKYNETRKRYVPDTRATLGEAIRALDYNDPLHSIYDNHPKLRYDYGSSFWNYCYMLPPPEGPYLPSLLRTMELRVDTQYWLRTAIGCMITLKIFFTIVRIRRFSMWNPSNHNFLNFMVHVSVGLKCLYLISAFLILCLHQDQDKSLRWLMKEIIPFFGGTFIAHAICYTFLDVFNESFDKRRMQLRMMCILAFITSIVRVQQSRLEFLISKPCHSFVPFQDALLEYICIFSILLFNFSQFHDCDDLEIVLSSTQLESTSYASVGDFKPAYVFSPEFDNVPYAHLKPIGKLPI